MNVRFLVRIAAGAAIAGAVWAPALAGTPAPSPSPSAKPLVEIGHIVTSDRRAEPIGHTTRPTFVIDRSQIEATGARTVADVLQSTPGVEIFRYGAFGSQADFGVRGALPDQTLVLVDGQPIADPTTGAAYLEGLSTIGVGRIEVVESGTSTLYGTSAAGGTINVITAVPRGAYLEGSLGSFADRDVRAAIGDGTIGASFERHVATNAFAYPAFDYGGGACDFGSLQPCTFPAGVRANADALQSAVRLSLDAGIAKNLRVRARLDDSSLDNGVPGELTFLTPADRQGFATNAALFELEHALGATTYTLDVSGASQRLTFFDPSFGNDDTFTGRSQVSLRATTGGGPTDLVAGIDLARESGNFTFPNPPSATGAAQSQAALYAQAGYSPPNSGARFVAGLRGENDAPHGDVLAPSFGSSFRFGRVRLAGNVGESFRVPTLQDLYFPGFSNPNLVPERAASADATVEVDTGEATLSAGWFTRNGSNFIVFDPVQNIPVNARIAQTAGVMFTARSRPQHGLVFDASFTNLYRALDVTTGGRLPRSPVGQGSVGIAHPFGSGALAYGARFGIVGSDGDDTANVSPPLIGRFDSYSSVDAYLRFKLAPQTVLSLRGYNLGDDREAPIFGYPNVGRRVMVEVSTR